MPTRRRRILFVAPLLIAAAYAVHYWLNNGPLIQTVLSAIARYYGGYVELDRVSINRSGLTLHGLRLRESSDPHSRIICEVPEAELTGSVADLWQRDFRPTSITLRRPVARIFQSPDGTWNFRPPLISPDVSDSDSMVAIDIADATIEFARPGTSATRSIQHIDMHIQPVDSPGEVSVRGSANDPIWGAWSIDGAVGLQAAQLRASIRCPKLRLSSDLVHWIRSQSDDWGIELDGTVAADVTVNCAIDGRSAPRYVVLLEPQDARVQLPLVPEPIHDLSGRVEITQDAIRVHGLSGECAGGHVIFAGELARTETPGLQFSLDFRRL